MSKLNILILLIVGYLTVFSQSAFNPMRAILGVQPDLLPSFMVFVGLTVSLIPMTLVAVACGLWYDALSANPLGVSMLPLFLVGYVLRNYQGLILRDQHYAQWVLGGVASALAPLLTLILLWLHGRHPLLSWFSLWQWLAVILVGAACTPLWFIFLDRILHALSYGTVEESSFRPDRQIKRGRY